MNQTTRKDAKSNETFSNERIIVWPDFTGKKHYPKIVAVLKERYERHCQDSSVLFQLHNERFVNELIEELPESLKALKNIRALVGNVIAEFKRLNAQYRWTLASER